MMARRRKILETEKQQGTVAAEAGLMPTTIEQEMKVVLY